MGAIINFFKGIIELVTGLFSGGKKTKDGFFMEAPPVAGSPAPTSAPTTVAAAPKQEKAAKQKKGGVPESAKKKAKAPKGKKAAAAAAAAVAVTTAAAPAPAASVTTEIEAATAGLTDPAEIVRAALAATATPQVSPQEAEVASDPSLNTGQPTFAEMNAVPYSTGGRRRPGANLAGFKDLAKTMKK